jgi:exonuclease VII large subunit
MMAENFAPQRLLRLGFAIARSNNGVIRSTDDVTLGQRITIEVANGSITAEIVEKDESNE